MKYLIIVFLFSISFCYSQKSKSETFYVYNREFTYQSIDYSEYGVLQNTFYITSNKQEYDLMFKNAKKCLKEKVRLYHSFYFFLLIPEDVKSQKQKEVLVSEFIKHNTNQFKNPNINIYMDKEYSKEYLKQIVPENTNKIKNLYIDLTAELICRTI